MPNSLLWQRKNFSSSTQQCTTVQVPIEEARALGIYSETTSNSHFEKLKWWLNQHGNTDAPEHPRITI